MLVLPARANDLVIQAQMVNLSAKEKTRLELWSQGLGLKGHNSKTERAEINQSNEHKIPEELKRAIEKIQ